MTFNKVLRGMQHERIKYQTKVMDELKDKNKITMQTTNDEEFENKIRELQSKSYKKDDNSDE